MPEGSSAATTLANPVEIWKTTNAAAAHRRRCQRAAATPVVRLEEQLEAPRRAARSERRRDELVRERLHRLAARELLDDLRREGALRSGASAVDHRDPRHRAVRHEEQRRLLAAALRAGVGPARVRHVLLRVRPRLAVEDVVGRDRDEPCPERPAGARHLLGPPDVHAPRQLGIALAGVDVGRRARVEDRLGPEGAERRLDRPAVAEIRVGPAERSPREAARPATEREHLVAPAELQDRLAAEEPVRPGDRDPHLRAPYCRS